jgi:hypothetical protein
MSGDPEKLLRPVNSNRYMFLPLDRLRNFNAGILLAACFVNSACSAANDKSIAFAATKQFHARFNNTDFGDIYDGTEPGVRLVTREDFIIKLESMRNGVGAVLQSEEVSLDDHNSTDVAVVKVCCEVKYEKAAGREEFVWIIANGKAVLRSFKAPTWPRPVC